jgi:predicted negative regulator of RcsB-dependent stress response
MDQKRLGGVQRQDLTESRLNDDFVYWLRTSGPNWLLGIMVVACLVLGWQWWKNSRAAARDTAWQEFASASLPSALRDVAARHGNVDSVAAYALLTAGDRYLMSVQTGMRFDRDVGDADARLTPEMRTQWLGEADSLYSQVISAAGDKPQLAAFAAAGLFGRAAVAETQGRFDDATALLKQAQNLTSNRYPAVSAQATKRLATVEDLRNPYPVPPGPATGAFSPDGMQLMPMAEPPVTGAADVPLGSAPAPAEPAPAPAAPAPAPAPAEPAPGANP